MPKYTAGSVSAEITLDTTKFSEKIDELKGKVKVLQETLNKTSIDTLAKKVEQLEKQFKSSSKTIDNTNEEIKKLKSTLSDLENVKIKWTGAENFDKAWKNTVKSFKRSVAEIENAIKKIDGSALEKYVPSAMAIQSEMESQLNLEGAKVALNEYLAVLRKTEMEEQVYWQTRQSNLRNAMEAYVSGVRNIVIAQRQLFATEGGYNNYINTLSKVRREFGKVSDVNFTKLSDNIYKNGQLVLSMGESWRVTQAKVYEATRLMQMGLKEVDGELVSFVKNIVKGTEVLNTFDFKILQSVETTSKAYQNITKLASAMQRMNSQGTENWAGRGQFGYSQYIQSITKINQGLQKQAELEAKIKAQRLDQYYAKVGAASTKYWNQIRSGQVNLNTYKSNMSQINQKISEQTQRTEKLRAAQTQLWQKYHTTNLNTYKANMSEINKKLEEQTTNARKAGQGLTSFNDGIVKTAHSGRILSNTLYQIRGALLSLKMIATAMGGMAVWGFLMDIGQSVKQTFTAKNEMEAQLNQNSKVSANGVKSFQKALDDLTKTYKKVNKYSIGETVSSIGLEFNLTAKQMKDALPIVTMIQSEYVRAGRTAEDAALAVKDILQGEFQRLSRETGVGKEELIAYGWDEDKTNIDGLLKALDKAAKDRNWDVFAKKATSLNDVMEILKSRFSETGADFLQSITPAIVEGFNLMIGAIEGFQKAFNNLGSFEQNFLTFGSFTAIISGIGTVLPMIIKGMGLADIATIGWGKSLLTTVFNLNKAEVGFYGFRKALAAVITGTKASELANVGATKAILGRILGVKQATLAEHGFLTALVKNKMEISTIGPLMSDASVASLKWYQKLGYLSGGLKETEIQTAGLGKSLLKTATSWTVLGTAIKGVMVIGVIAWLASVATWTDKVKKNVEGYNKVVDEGDDLVADAKTTYDNYVNSVSKLDEQIAKANAEDKDATNLIRMKNKALQNQYQAYKNLGVIQRANSKAKEFADKNEQRMTDITTEHQTQLAKAYMNVGNTGERASELAVDYYNQVLAGNYYINKGMSAYRTYLEGAVAHSERLGKEMKAVGVDQETVNQFMVDYNMAAEEAAEHWRKFNEGEMLEGAYALLSELKQAWIELTYNKDFRTFMQSVTKWYNSSLRPILIQAIDFLKQLAIYGAKAFTWLTSTDIGKTIASIGVMGTAIGFVALKLGKWATGSKSVIDFLKKLKDKIPEVIDKIKNLGDKAKDTGKKLEDSGISSKTNKPSDPTTSTGGITGGVEKGKFWETVGQDARNTGRSMFKYMGYIAAATILATEAILLLNAPMLALAGTGVVFKSIEPQVRKGIDGLKLIAPVVLALLAPMIALMYVLGRFNIDSSTLTKGFKDAAVGVALGITLVSEALILLNAPLLGLAVLGSVYGGVEDAARQGIEAMKVVNQALTLLAEWVPVFALGVGLAAIAFAAPELGIPAILATALGIAVGIGLVTEAMLALCVPLEALGEIGANFPDLSNVQQGAEALKITSEALGYVEEGMSALAGVKWAVLSDAVAQLIGVKIGVDLSNLTGEDGFFSQLEEFTKQFNEINITPINTSKVETLKSSATGIDTVKEALNTVKDALKNLPNFEVDNRSPNEKYQDATSGANVTEGISNYFEQLRQPIEQLKEFIDKFNNEIDVGEGVNMDKVAIIQQSADSIGAINSAIEAVKTALGNAVDAAWAGNMASGGFLGAAAGLIVGDGNPNASGLKSGLDELYLSVKDIMDFNTKIAGLTSSQSGDTSSVEGASNMVSALQTQINSLKTTLEGAVPTIKATAENMGKSIVEGFKSGISTLGTSITGKIDEITPTIESKAESLGKDHVAPKFKSGIDKVSDAMSDELTEIGKAIDDKKDELGQKAYNLGKYMSDKYREGNDMNSPGIMARSTSEEMGYIGQYLQEASVSLPQLAGGLAQSISNAFTNANGGGILSVPSLDEFQSGLGQIPAMAENVKTQVSTSFGNMKTTVGTALATTATNATSKYTQIVNTTRTSLSNMQSQTTKNIGSIKTSWSGMQTALIQSAENIRSQTGEKIRSLQSNMATFWKKVQNPALLLGGSAGSANEAKHTTRQGSSIGNISRKGTTRRMLAAGSSGTGSRYTGISDKIKPSSTGGSKTLVEYLMNYIECLKNGGRCAAGWNFNWSPSIKKSFKGWHTHFGEIYDDVLNVGKFENDTFPVRGNATIAKRYIKDAISRTDYEYYYDYKYGSPLAAWLHGAFNCVEGASIAIALANAFGFGGGTIRYGTWDGEGHGFADIPGLGIIDATAIQKGYGFTSPKVRGYGSKSLASSAARKADDGQTNNYNGDVNLTINVYGDDVEVNENKVDNSTGKAIIDLLGINPSTGL